MGKRKSKQSVCLNTRQPSEQTVNSLLPTAPNAFSASSYAGNAKWWPTCSQGCLICLLGMGTGPDAVCSRISSLSWVSWAWLLLAGDQLRRYLCTACGCRSGGRAAHRNQFYRHLYAAVLREVSVDLVCHSCEEVFDRTRIVRWDFPVTLLHASRQRCQGCCH